MNVDRNTSRILRFVTDPEPVGLPLPVSKPSSSVFRELGLCCWPCPRLLLIPWCIVQKLHVLLPDPPLQVRFLLPLKDVLHPPANCETTVPSHLVDIAPREAGPSYGERIIHLVCHLHEEGGTLIVIGDGAL